MKKHQAEVEKVLLGHEKEVYKKLKKTYDQAFKDINRKSKELQKAIDKLVEEDPDNETLIRSKIYQLNYQKTLQAQISGYMDVLKSEHVKDIDDYMKIMYEDSYISNFYSLNKEGVPVTAPINQDLMIKALTYDTNNIPLSKRVYDNVEKAKKDVLAEIQRGISTGMSSQDIARNIQNRMGVSYRKAKQLAQNEGHRIRTEATLDSMRAAKAKGADIVKQWDSTLDNKTRPVHRELHGQYAEVEEPFKCSAGSPQAPKMFGIAAQDINCRCALLSVPRWDIEDEPVHRDNISGELINAGSYEEWKLKYYVEIESENVRKGAEIAKQSRERLRKAGNIASSVVKKAVVAKVIENGLNKKDSSAKISSELRFTLDIQFFAENDLQNQSVTSLKKGIRHFEKRITEHEAKIENPEAFYPTWNDYSDRAKEGFKKHWKKEIENFKESIENRYEELKKRGE